jgi:hypothetical protein
MVKKLVDGWGKEWNRNYIPEYIRELNENPIGVVYPKNNYVFSRHLPLKNHPEVRIDVEFEMIDKPPYYRMWTDELKYGERLEILFDNQKQCFTIKDLDKLRKKWSKTHLENVVTDVDSLERYIDEMP